MARIDWVKQRLDNWALWKERDGSGGLGFPTSSSFTKEPSSGYREAVIPVDEVEASLTDAAVESLKYTRSHLYLTLQLIYVQGCGIKAAARNMARAESTIKAQLEQADHALAKWFTDRKAKFVQEQRLGRPPPGSFTP